MIKTKQIDLSIGKYFRILATSRFRKDWYTHLLPFVAAPIAYFLVPPDYAFIPEFLVAYGVIMPLWILVYLYIHASSDKADYIRMKRYYEIDGKTITAIHADKTMSEIEIEDIVGVKEQKDEMLVYFSKTAFLYLPYLAFEKEDLNTFKEWLHKR